MRAMHWNKVWVSALEFHCKLYIPREPHVGNSQTEGWFTVSDCNFPIVTAGCAIKSKSTTNSHKTKRVGAIMAKYLGRVESLD